MLSVGEQDGTQVLWKWKQQDGVFEASLGYIVRHYPPSERELKKEEGGWEGGRKESGEHSWRE